MYSALMKDETEYRRPLTQHLRTIQFECGGILLEKISKKYKLLWIIQNVGSTALVISSGIAYLVTEPESDLYTLLYTAKSAGMVFVCTVVNLGWIRYGDSLNNLIRIMDTQFIEYSAELYKSGIFFVRVYHWMNTPLGKKFRTLVPLALATLPGFILVCLTLFYDDSKMNHISGYPYPFPGLHKMGNTMAYIVVIFLQCVTLTPSITLGIMTALFIVAFCEDVGKEFEQLNEDIRLQTEKFDQRMSAIYDDEVKLKKNPIKILAIKRRACCIEFFQHVEKYIQRHRLLMKSIDLFKPFVEGFFTWSLSFLTFFLVLAGFIIWVPEGGSRLSVLEIIVLFGGVLCQTLHICYIGTSFRNMGENTEMAVYSMPWYELTPKQRKVVHLFLGQAQLPVKFNAAKIYPTSMELVPKVTNFVYSQIVGLKTIRDKK